MTKQHHTNVPNHIINEASTSNENAESRYQKAYMSISEASHFLNIKVSHIRSLVFQNAIPVIRIGRLLRFSQEDLTEWINNSKNTL